MDNIRFAKLITKVAKEAPKTLFEKAFYDIREKAKKQKEEEGKKAVIAIGNTLKKDLQSKGFKAEVDVKLGKFRGSEFVTSAIILLQAKQPFVEGDKRLDNILNYLVATYSPKYKLKEINDGVAKFNVR